MCWNLKKNSKTFLNKGTKYKQKLYGNKNIEGGGSP